MLKKEMFESARQKKLSQSSPHRGDKRGAWSERGCAILTKGAYQVGVPCGRGEKQACFR